jgi:hypothetical protein
VTSVAERLGVSAKSLFDFVKRYGSHQSRSAGSETTRRSNGSRRSYGVSLRSAILLKKATAFFANDHR